MKHDLVVAGKAMSAASLTGIVGYLIADAPARQHVYWPYWVLLGGIGAGIIMYLVGQERTHPAGQENDPPPVEVSDDAAPAVTDRWRPVINGVSQGVLQLQSSTMSHPGYSVRSPEDSPPSLRVGMRVACAEPGQSASSSGLRAAFLGFLAQPGVMNLIRGFAEVQDGAEWTARGDNPPYSFGAVLMQPEKHEAPVAWARLMLPDSLSRRLGSDATSAYLLLCAEPPAGARAASLAVWHQRLSEALSLPAAFAAMLADDLGLPTASAPPAEVAVWMTAAGALTQLVEVSAFNTVAGTPWSNWFSAFAVASPDGEQIPEAAQAWLRHMCDSSLHLDDYEPALASLSGAAGMAGDAGHVPG
jgi:hypothetical protein